jgi:hypothetical protein
MLRGVGVEAPSKPELDRLQAEINGRPDLEVVKQQMIDLDGWIRAVIAKISPHRVRTLEGQGGPLLPGSVRAQHR